MFWLQDHAEQSYWENVGFDMDALSQLPKETFAESLVMVDTRGFRQKFLWDYFLPHYSCPQKEKVGVLAVRVAPYDGLLNKVAMLAVHINVNVPAVTCLHCTVHIFCSWPSVPEPRSLHVRPIGFVHQHAGSQGCSLGVQMRLISYRLE